MFSVSIKQRLSIGFTLLVLLAGVGCGVSWWLSGNTSKMTRQMIQRDVMELKNAQNAQIALKTADDQAIRFLFNRNLDHVQNFNIQIKKTVEELASLHSMVLDTSKRQQIDEALQETQLFSDQFQQVVSIHKHRGLTHKQGLEGALRKAVHDIESAVNAYQLPDLTVLVLMCRRHEKDYLLRGDPKYLDKIKQRIQTFKIMMLDADIPSEKKSEIRKLWDNYYQGVSDIVNADKQIAQALASMNTTHDQLIEKVSDIGRYAMTSIDHKGNRVLNLLGWSQNLMLILMGSVVGLGLVVATLISRSIVNPLRMLVARFKDISEGEGDLTQRVEFHHRKDEFGELARAFNTFLDDLRQLIAEARNTTDHVAKSAYEIASSHEEMSQTVAQQERQMFEVSAAIEQMSATAMHMTDQAGQTTQCAADARELALEGGTHVEQTVTGMQGIHESVSVTSQSIARLGEHGQQIGQIINVINDIAEQTNLLALNAAIEAARAGKHGQGFSVVANAVRKLADRTTAATSEIADSIQVIQDETRHAVTQIQAGTDQVNDGMQMAQQAGESLQRIVKRASDVNQEIQKIASGSQEQAQSAACINHNVEAITEMAGQTNASMASAAQATTTLSKQAKVLQQSIGRFKI